jgi:hypothetical protein
LLVSRGSLGFIGDVRYLGGGSPDSTLALVTISLANRSLSFRADGPVQRAGYAVLVELRLAESDSVVVRAESRETVRVGTPRETTAIESGVVFQRFVRVAPGAYKLWLTVRDEGGVGSGSLETALVVPRFGGGTLSSPVLVYRAEPRTDAESLPDLIANPRATVVFGQDSLALVYLEGYRLPPAARVSLEVLDERQRAVLRDTVMLQWHGTLSTAVERLPISRVGVGRLAVMASLVGSGDTVTAPLLVSFGSELGVMSFEEMLSRLRYYASPEQVRTLSEAAPEQRAAAWTKFWEESDPSPGTAGHEDLRDYFERIEVANRRFGREGSPGWLTDQGKVYVALGEPTRVLSEGYPETGMRGSAQLWEYDSYGVRLVFVADDAAFDQWRLTPRSELDFERALARARSHSRPH